MTMRRRVVLRQAESSDNELLVRIYAQTRAAELALVPWPAEQKEAFVRSQWQIRRAAYESAHPASRYEVVVTDDTDVGCLFVAELDDGSIRVVDVALLEEWCGRGVGSVVFAPLIDDADRRGVAVSLHVDPHSAAVRFYERLGFVAVDDDPMYRLMVRPAGTPVR